MRVVFERLAVPDFGRVDEKPVIPPAVYAARLARLLVRMAVAKLDCVAVYADREHSANLSYLTGFDPRFEEALLVLTAAGRRTLIVGNECHGVLSDLPVDCEILLCQEFSLMGQDRSVSWDLRPLLAEAGVARGQRCGSIGWKTLREGRIEIPAYIAALLAEATGTPLVNANDLLMHEETGLRLINEPEQTAFYEYAASRTSASVLALLRGLQPGKRGIELARAFDLGGLELSCHAMLSFGQTITNGMASPTNARLAVGDCLTTALGLWGSLTCRAGLVIANATGFSGPRGEVHRQVIENYLLVTRAWYAALSVGATAGAVWRAAEAQRDDALYTFCVNTGHYLHLDEWVNSPFRKGAAARLPSSAALQADIIPVGRKTPVTVNMEDGVVLADAALRQELARVNPGLLRRCEQRRQFMRDALGYQLSDDVLPLSDVPGCYFPFLLDTGVVCRFVED